MCEHYKENVKQEVTEYIPVIIRTITLYPSKQHRLLLIIIFSICEFYGGCVGQILVFHYIKLGFDPI